MISRSDLRVFSGLSGYTGFLPHTKKLWPFCTSNLLIIRFEMKAFWKSVWDHHKEHSACSGLSLCMGVLNSVVSSIFFRWNPSFKHLNKMHKISTIYYSIFSMSIQINKIINSIINCLNHGCFLFYNCTFIILPNIKTSPMLEHSTDDWTFEQFEK